MTAAPVYPVFLRLDGAPVVVVGGGAVAASKLDGLLAAGAVVTVIAPALHRGCVRPDVTWVARGFVDDDLDGARFVIAAAPPDVNRAVARAAAARNLFVNAVDDRDSATAYLGGVIRRGDITLAISTGGAAPALAGLLREAIAALLPDELDAWLATAVTLRAELRGSDVPLAERRERLRAALIATGERGAA